MRTLTLLIIAITMACNAANYFVEGMEWKMVKYPAKTSPEDPEPYFETLYLEGCERLDDKTCVKLWSIIEGEQSEKQLLAYIFTDGDEVYFRLPDNDSWKLLYDFNMTEEQQKTFTPLRWNNSVCNREVQMQCKTRYGDKALTDCDIILMWELANPTTGDINPFPFEWIDGIGAKAGPDANCGLSGFDGTGGSILQQASLNGKILYQNSSATLNTVTPDNIQTNSPRYNVDGTPFSNGDTGIYIEDGKKHIAR